jgi:alpha,alpha-trehalase
LKSDYSDIQGGTTPEGIHLGAMAGSVNIMQDAYTGTEPRENVLWFNPCLPEEIEKLKMEIRYRGHTLEIEVASDKFTIRDLRCTEEPVKIGFNRETFEIGGRDSRTFDL